MTTQKKSTPLEFLINILKFNNKDTSTEQKKEPDGYEVNRAIHREDLIFQYVLTAFQSDEARALKYYFENGLDSTQKLGNILETVCGYGGDKPIQLLEFASGYGCITRHVKEVIPFADTTACDIHPQAMQFISENFKTSTLLSTVQPEELNPEQKFDAVFALSFFSHMPKKSFSRWLKRLASFLKPGGHLIFTTHGFVTSKRFPCQFDSDGFHFHLDSEQTDLELADYGTACTLPTYVTSLIFNEPNWELVFFQQGYWWGHQDVYVIKCSSEPGNSHVTE